MELVIQDPGEIYVQLQRPWIYRFRETQNGLFVVVIQSHNATDYRTIRALGGN